MGEEEEEQFPPSCPMRHRFRPLRNTTLDTLSLPSSFSAAEGRFVQGQITHTQAGRACTYFPCSVATCLAAPIASSPAWFRRHLVGDRARRQRRRNRRGRHPSFRRGRSGRRDTPRTLSRVCLYTGLGLHFELLTLHRKDVDLQNGLSSLLFGGLCEESTSSGLSCFYSLVQEY